MVVLVATFDTTFVKIFVGGRDRLKYCQRQQLYLRYYTLYYCVDYRAVIVNVSWSLNVENETA